MVLSKFIDEYQLKHFKTKFVVLTLFSTPYSCLTKHVLRWLVSLKAVASLYLFIKTYILTKTSDIILTKTYIDHCVESNA